MDGLQHFLETTFVDRFGWPADPANEVTRYAHIVPYEHGATIFNATESTDFLYLLVCGEVKLYFGTPGGERLLAGIARTGQLLGCTDLEADGATPQDQIFSAQALSRCKVAIMARGRVASLLGGVPGPQLIRILHRMNEPWVELCRRALTFLTLDVRARLAYVITDIAAHFGIPDARGQLISLKLSHEDFAELVGASRPMVSKHLKELATAGIFIKEHARYILTRPLAQAVPDAPLVRVAERPAKARLTSVKPAARPGRPQLTRLAANSG